MSERLKRIEFRLAQIENQLGRITASLDLLVEALADEGDDDEPQFDLDGNLIENFERDDNESLD
ncbi:hypothetical protein G5B41_17790 [bacterium SGD-2]|nr:hypothetical protein [bacterium SGD-2]